jgi:acetyl-CoA C-acetyltransferase
VPEAVIVAAARSPIGRAFKGSLKDVRPDDLLAEITRAALDQVPGLDATGIDDIYAGAADNSGQHGNNIARVVAVMLGLANVPGASINRFCASSVQTQRMAFHAIKAGEGDAFISAGVECVSRYLGLVDGEKALNPIFDEARARTAETQASNAPWTDPLAEGWLPDPYIAMGQTAENVATLRGVSRLEQDQWAAESQNRAEKAIADGFYAREITPVTLPDGTVVSTDDSPRPGTTLDKLGGLKPVFRETGTVTAGNACPLNDGAAALVIMSDVRAQELGLTPLARIVATGVSALSPEIMGLGPVDASNQALARAGMSIADIDLVEINEAFAAQVLPSAEDLGIDTDKLNVHGGAIALGHPFGMTGARIAVTLLNGLRSRDVQFGLETMCVAGGQGMAIIYERLS